MPLNEGTPLLFDDWVVPTRTVSYILLLTVIVGGLQLSWSAEFSNGTPFLLSLGMSKTLMSLVWIAGPLAGTIGQPIVGALSDDCRLSFGRRRPFIIAGAVATIVSLLVLSWSKDIVRLLLPAGADESEVKRRTIPVAVAFVYILDFSIQIIMASARAFIVDNVPIHQQQLASAWAARMIGLGSIVGFVLGSLKLPELLPFLGDTQFKALSGCASIALVLSVLPSCLAVKERDPAEDWTIAKDPRSGAAKLAHIFSQTIDTIRNRLSPQTKLVCAVQFFAWVGYFPLLFYTTTYIGGIYLRQVLRDRPGDAPPFSDSEWAALQEEATRRGTQAMVFYSFTSVAANFLLPYIAQPSYTSEEELETFREAERYHHEASIGARLKYATFCLLYGMRVPGLTVRHIWTYSHLLFIACMLATFWLTNDRIATVWVSVLGIVWAVSQWSPYTIISEEISQIKVLKCDAEADAEILNYEHEPGIILGVMNIFVSAPQVLSSLMASLLFKIFASDSPVDENDSLGWVYRFGGLSTIVACYLSLYIKEPRQ
ncbi:hypothetical protein TRVA0_011S01442 [Trichomonascus vanleenenianus]|uniref:uncharacterized protein n=1 Tax=Trichomonascus vanleenenianus TaxID=2268995 RepID=UPI003ECAFBD0